MTADQLRRLAVLIERTDYDAIDRAAAYLRACAEALDAGPVAWRIRIPGESELGHWFGEVPLGEGYTNEALYPVAMPGALRLPEPMTDAEAHSLLDDISHLPSDFVVREVESTVIKRVKEANE